MRNLTAQSRDYVLRATERFRATFTTGAPGLLLLDDGVSYLLLDDGASRLIIRAGDVESPVVHARHRDYIMTAEEIT